MDADGWSINCQFLERRIEYATHPYMKIGEKWIEELQHACNYLERVLESEDQCKSCPKNDEMVKMAKKPTEYQEYDKKGKAGWQTHQIDQQSPEGNQSKPEANCIHFKDGACEVLDLGVYVASSEEVAKLKKVLRFMDDFFKSNFEYLFENKAIQDFMVEHEEFDEVEKLCQV